VVELARRASLREAARGIGVTYETARGYLKTVLHKCGARTQNELIARLLSDWSLFARAG
jgi:DNA-binding CsgD family transcriptional regulator